MEAYYVATAWETVPAFMKGVLITSALLMSMSVYVLSIMGEDCFEAVDTTTDVKAVFGNDPMKIIVAPWGYICLALMGASVLRCRAVRNSAMFVDLLVRLALQTSLSVILRAWTILGNAVGASGARNR